ncbi:MAG: hypothetical protein H6621_12725 [Halobacteriovoraceae bacterium]|nr:hypothetical protein [Halobacteriovoraceae bacterium]MCB9095925.1 hypothetical protein [Halobacteriovoraceae bacterium]
MTIKKNDSVKFDIQEYAFQNFSNTDAENVIKYEFENLDSKKHPEIEKRKNHINPESELRKAHEKGFRIEGIVREHREIDKYQDKMISEKVKGELDLILDQEKKQASEKGYEEGKSIALREWEEKLKTEYQQKIDLLENFFQEIKGKQEEIIENYKDSILHLVNDLTKWMIYEDSKNDEYIIKVFEKLLNEVDSFKNLKITFDEESYSHYSEIIEKIKDNVGILQNYQVSKNLHSQYKGLRIESDKMIIDSTLEKKFEILDEIFDQVRNENAG